MNEIDRIMEVARRDSRCVGGGEQRKLCDEIDRLRKLLWECWPCVWDAVYGRYPNKRDLLERMDEFARDQK